jgi:RNA ligase (TIGR02306 family)
MRKLASIRRISDIQPIPGADAIEVCTVDGWKVVAQKAMGYKVGDLVVYFEIDSWVPHTLAPFLTKNAAMPKVFNGVEGERLRTVKLRGQVSQGLLMPLTVLDQFGTHIKGVAREGWKLHNGDILILEEGADVTDVLGIQKWEAPLPTELRGQAQGMFPTQFAPKTDQERVQNMFREVYARKDEFYEWSLKLDGSSMTVFKIDGVLRVASRNLELKINEENAGNSYVKKAMEIGKLIEDVDNIVIQGELMGPGIQGNRENLKDVTFFVFDIVDPKSREKWDADRRTRFVMQHGLMHVPVLGTYRELPFESVQEMLDFADSITSLTHKVAEGVVFKSLTDPEFSFKVISNKFLLKGGD